MAGRPFCPRPQPPLSLTHSLPAPRLGCNPTPSQSGLHNLKSLGYVPRMFLIWDTQSKIPWSPRMFFIWVTQSNILWFT